MGLPTGFETLYVGIANDYAAIYDNLDAVEDQALDAVNRVVDTTASDYENNGRQIELLLLNRFNQAYTASRNIKSSTVTILDAVRAINNYVASNYDGEVTPEITAEYAESLADARLRGFINDVAFSGGDCPDGWAQLSAEAGYVVDAWETDVS